MPEEKIPAAERAVEINGKKDILHQVAGCAAALLCRKNHRDGVVMQKEVSEQIIKRE